MQTDKYGTGKPVTAVNELKVRWHRPIGPLLYIIVVVVGGFFYTHFTK